MTKIAQNTVAKLSVAFVAAAMVLSMVAPAQAQTVEELQAQIAALMAQINGLQTTTGTGSCVSIPAPLTMGSQGADVTALQNALIAAGQSIPAGATGYFGGQTQAALAAWQAANGVSPAAGYYGPITKAAMDAKCVPDTDGGDDNGTDDGDDDSTDEDTDLQGEASLDDVQIEDAADSDIEEGEEDVEVASVVVEFVDGDAEISRVDLQLLGDTQSDTSTVEPWEAFDTISLWVDGDMVGEADISDEDGFLDEDAGTIRLSGLDIVAMEDEDLEITIAVTTQDNLDSAELTDWDLSVNAIRFFDADGVATTEDAVGDMSGPTDVTFTLDAAGAEDELEVSSSDSDPSATTLILSDDADETFTVFAFDLDTDDSTNDIQINQLVLDATVSSGTAAAFISNDDVALLVDGEELATDDITVSGNTLTFEFDNGDFVIEAGETATVELEVTFDALNAGDAGTTISFDLTGNTTKIDAEGADDLGGSQISGAASGETHTMITEGIVILADDVEFTTDTSGDNDTLGEFEITFDVTAYEDTFYITDNAAADSASNGAVFTFEGPATSTATVTATLTSTADEDTTGVFTVDEGDTETFTLRVTLDVATGGDYRVTLDSVYYSTNTNGTTGAVARTLSPASDYRTGYETIQAN